MRTRGGDKGPSASLAPSAARSTYIEYASRAAFGRRLAAGPLLAAPARPLAPRVQPSGGASQMGPPRRSGFRVIALALVAMASWGAVAEAQVRVKDVVRLQGVRENNLYGYGVVMGLNGTGDRATSS